MKINLKSVISQAKSLKSNNVSFHISTKHCDKKVQIRSFFWAILFSLSRNEYGDLQSAPYY